MQRRFLPFCLCRLHLHLDPATTECCHLFLEMKVACRGSSHLQAVRLGSVFHPPSTPVPQTRLFAEPIFSLFRPCLTPSLMHQRPSIFLVARGRLPTPSFLWLPRVGFCQSLHDKP